MSIELICLDADDTLWHNMRYFEAAESALAAMLEPFATVAAAREQFEKVTARNLALYGYGAKSFTLSMLESAAELCGESLPASMIQAILAAGRQLLSHPVELFPEVEATLEALAVREPLVLVTKGDLLHQEAKIAASGIGHRFAAVEIVSDKTAANFRRLFSDHGVEPDRCVVAGDSVRSDVLPALEAGAWAAHVPHSIVWAHERREAPMDHPRFRRLGRLSDLPAWIDSLG